MISVPLTVIIPLVVVTFKGGIFIPKFTQVSVPISPFAHVVRPETVGKIFQEALVVGRFAFIIVFIINYYY